MKCLIWVAVLFLSAASMNAQDLSIKPFLVAKTPVKTKSYDVSKKEEMEVERWGYMFMLHIKNVSQKPLIVATDGFNQQTTPGEADQEVKLDMMELKSGGDSLVIPSIVDFRLVELRPNEVALMKIEFKTKVPLKQLKVIYNPKDFYQGRFAYWTGTVTSEPLVLQGQ